ncbi:MAG: methyl-accepting chemotaxis protein [Mariprofundales bacterium]
MTRLFSDWPVKKRLSMISGLMLGVLLAAMASYQTESFINRHIDAQITTAQQQLHSSEALEDMIDIAHARMLNYLYMGGEVNRDISLANAQYAIASLRNLSALTQSNTAIHDAVVTMADRLDAFLIQLQQSAKELRYSEPMSEGVLGAIIDLNMIEHASLRAQKELTLNLKRHVNMIQHDSEHFLMVSHALFLGAMILGFVLIASCVYCMSISILHPLEHLAQAIAHMGRGRYNFSLSHLLQGGELGQLVQSVEKAKADTQQNHIVFQMTEQMPHAIMMANRTTMEIEYLNQSALALFATIEEHLPFPANEILGKSMNMFHKNPHRQQKMMGDKKAFPIRSSFPIGGKQIAFSAVAIDNVEGDWSHIMVCWEDISEQDQLQNSVHSRTDALIARAIICSQGTEEIGVLAQCSYAIATSVASRAKGYVQGVAAMTSNIQGIVSSFQGVTDKLAETKTIADQAVTEVSGAQFALFEFETAAGDISDVVHSIEKIASNIRTLSMNATIEAARAGEYGAGFSVVAKEVRKLALDAAAATQAVKAGAAALNSNLAERSDSFRQVENAMERLYMIASDLETTAQEQGVSAAEIVTHANIINADVQNITQDMKLMLEQTKKTESYTEVIIDEVKTMQHESGEFNTHIAQFVEKMRQV